MNNKNLLGFSLVEMSVVLIIAGIILSSITQSYSVYLENRRVNVTYDRMHKIKLALQEFYEVQGRYPCPADPDGIVAGVENCTPLNTVGKVKAVNGRDTIYPGDDEVLIGSIPYETIREGLQDRNPFDTDYADAVYEDEEDEYMGDYVPSTEFVNRGEVSDDWGRQFSYMVSEPLTSQASYNKEYASIYVESEDGESLVSPVGSAAWVLLSHGDNGIGGYISDGELPLHAGCVGLEANEDNCDLDPGATGELTIISSLVNKFIGSSDYYDDIVFFSQASSGGFWAKARNSQNTLGSSSERDIYNRSLGFVGVGTKNPVQRLDVSGKILSDKITSGKVCNSDGSVCINPADFVSKCNGQLITGISAAGGLICGGVPSPATVDLTNAEMACVENPGDSGACIEWTGICMPGYYVLGFTSAGEVICGLP